MPSVGKSFGDSGVGLEDKADLVHDIPGIRAGGSRCTHIPIVAPISYDCLRRLTARDDSKSWCCRRYIGRMSVHTACGTFATDPCLSSARRKLSGRMSVQTSRM